MGFYVQYFSAGAEETAECVIHSLGFGGRGMLWRLGSSRNGAKLAKIQRLSQSSNSIEFIKCMINRIPQTTGDWSIYIILVPGFCFSDVES